MAETFAQWAFNCTGTGTSSKIKEHTFAASEPHFRPQGHNQHRRKRGAVAQVCGGGRRGDRPPAEARLLRGGAHTPTPFARRIDRWDTGCISTIKDAGWRQGDGPPAEARVLRGGASAKG